MNSNLKNLLNQYQQKRSLEIQKANQEKYLLYNKIPEFEKVDHDINSLSIKLIQETLTSKSSKDIVNTKKKIESLKNKRKKILNDNGYTLDSLSPKFECDKCNDTGYVKTSNGDVLCSCIKQKLYNIAYNNANIYDLRNQNFDKFDISLYSDEVNKDKYKFDISPRQNMISIRKTCEKFIENFDSPSQNNLLFCGNTGLGKTFLSSCVANELIKKDKTVLYQTAPIMLDKIIDYKFGKSSDDIIDSIYSVDLLIIDDLGTETKNNLKITELFNIINTRLLNQNNKITKTIISTNLSLQQLYNFYEERIVSRIIGNYDACYFFGDDIRIKKKFTVTN